MALTKGDSPLLWRGARGEAKSVNIFRVNIPNDNTKNINTLTIEIVGFDVTGSSVPRPFGILRPGLGFARPKSPFAPRPSPFAPRPSPFFPIFEHAQSPCIYPIHSLFSSASDFGCCAAFCCAL